MKDIIYLKHFNLVDDASDFIFLFLISTNYKSNADFSSLIQHFFVGVLVLHMDLGLGEVLCSKQLSLTNLEQVFFFADFVHEQLIRMHQV